MKSYFVILFFSLILCSEISTAQSWETVNPKPSSNSFYNTSFINDSTGCLITDEGEIFRTSNSGLTFEKVFNDNTYTFRGIDFIDDLRGFVAGQSGYSGNFLGKTTDGGLTWTKMIDPGGYTYFDVNFIDDMHGWICGWYSTIIRTTDGGNTWQKLSGNIGTHNSFSTFDFINKDTGFIGGSADQYPFKAILYKTFDGGVTLQPVELPALSEEIADIEMISENEIWLCEGHQIQGNTRLYHSTDAGVTWQTVNIGYLTSPGQKISFADSLKSNVVGSSSCFTTDDGWETWSQYYYFPDWPGAIFSGDWVNANVGFVVGQSGRVAKSTNGGSTWIELSSGSRGALSDLAFANNQIGCAVGSEQGFDYICQTTDGGETWVSVLDSTYNSGWIYDIMYTSETEAWASGSMNRIYHSTDGGNSWVMINPTDKETNYFYSVCSVPDGRIYAGGNILIYSDNNGGDWQWNDFGYPGYTIRRVIFTDPLNGFLVLWESQTSSPVWGKMLRTSDGGISWEDIVYDSNSDSLKILAADFITKDTGIISMYNSGLARTTDGGNTWEYVGFISNQPIWYLKMFNMKDVVATDANGGVYYSYDGGKQWEQVDLIDGSQADQFISKKPFSKHETRDMLQPEGVTGLLGTCFTEMGSGWMCRDEGLIKKYTYLNVGIEEPVAKKSADYKLYPNPASTYLNIVGENIPERVELYNNQGKRIQQYGGSIPRIDVSGLPSGIYVLQVLKGKLQQSLKFVKQ